MPLCVAGHDCIARPLGKLLSCEFETDNEAAQCQYNLIREKRETTRWRGDDDSSWEAACGTLDSETNPRVHRSVDVEIIIRKLFLPSKKNSGRINQGGLAEFDYRQEGIQNRLAPGYLRCPLSAFYPFRWCACSASGLRREIRGGRRVCEEERHCDPRLPWGCSQLALRG